MESAAVIVIFDQLFGERYETHLIEGAPEPFYHYVPKGYSKIFFRSDYTSSALHEVAHWCIAGPNRRRENDYGYFYVEDRNKEQQLQFQRVERKVQALEWVFSVAANVPFELSVDNFNEDEKIIKPTIKYLSNRKITVKGPYSADTAFLKKNRKNIDVIIGMYHDQVLTPLKTLFEYDAINITMGLPFLRVSPDHGPNEKMFGKNRSNPQSLIQALNFLDKK